MIDARHVSKVYSRGVYALRDVSLTVEKGDFVFLTGPSGAGKSTLLKLILRADVVSEGELHVAGRDLRSLSAHEVQHYRRNVGFVFQDFKLVPRKTVFENVTLVARALGATRAMEQRRAMQVLQGVGLEDRLDAFPEELSGGEQQRVAIARALVNAPALVLADEPTGNLDPDLSVDVMNLFREMNARGTTVVVATHDRALIRRMGRTTISLVRGTLAGEPGGRR
ncbi:MAG: cell division ATP-binding protein FtsE [Acidobacteria bacterium]|nr:cell division ATP-binding protein FtsE [Acidobacteriota bacterium]